MTSALGDGFGDIVVGRLKRNFLFEIKNPDGPPSDRKLTPDEIDFHMNWRGQVDKVETLAEILEIVRGAVSK